MLVPKSPAIGTITNVSKKKSKASSAFDLLADSRLEKRVVAVAFLPDTPSAYKDPRSSLREGRDLFVLRISSLFCRKSQPTSIHPIMIMSMTTSRSQKHIYAS